MRMSRIEQTAGGVVLVLLVIFTLSPFLSLLSVALAEPGTIPIGIDFTRELHWENFATVFHLANFPVLFWNSTKLVLMVVPLAVLLATMAAYALAILRVPGAHWLFLLFLAGLTVPGESLITPFYLQMRDLGLTNTLWAVALPLLALNLPFGVFWMRAHFMGVPAELDEAAQIDGAGYIRSFFTIHLPLARPALSTLVVLNFLWAWNHFILTLVMIDDPEKRTMPGALGGFQGEHGTDIVMLCAAALLMMLPTMTFFIVFQKQFTAALLRGSVKG